MWPSGTCPDVTIEGGLSCSATALDDGNCQYLCPGEGSDGDEWVQLTPPLAVTFERHDPDQRWTDILQRAGQTLSSYVDREEIYLDVDVSEWATDIPGSRISHVEFLEPGGGMRRYSLQEASRSAGEDGKPERLRILAPGATCDPLRYTLIGDRRYKESAATVVDGKAEPGDVHQTARLLTFNLTLVQGGGPAIAYGGVDDKVRDPTYFTALATLGANFRPRNPRWSRVAYEARIGGSIGQWGFYGPGSLLDEERRVTTKLPWARLLFEAGVVVDVISPLSLAASFGVGGSWPINNTDVAQTDRFAFVLSPSAEARFAIRRWISLVVQGRAVFRERTQIAIGLNNNTPIVRSFPNVSLLGLYGLQFSF
ncbi:hypothetical protein PPSIR1_13120 [Plesiocystis pacifica SIR-1]|uniref:Uncharacterized protein n=1 Tax=Plesiocystis pacifica SIR-1 TaxID=391625 RepID=A6GAX1_9BACT|nr:hypothetical protein PPSIR1_13120 [Plesiocystis pacifica SIR-1]